MWAFNVLVGFATLVASQTIEHFLITCTKVSQEDPHLVEWIEFHRIQGVEKFLLYYEAPPGDRLSSVSASRLLLLKEFYDQQGLETLIEIHSTGSLLSESINGFQYVDAVWHDYHRVAQNAAYQDCIRRYGHKTEWILTLDADEFVWVPDSNKETVRDYFHVIGFHIHEMYRGEEYPLQANGFLPKKLPLRLTRDIKNLMEQDAAEWIVYAKNDTLRGLHIPSVPYGSAGVMWEYNNLLSRDLLTGQVQLLFDPRDNIKFKTIYRQMTRSERKLLAGSGIKSSMELGDQWKLLRERLARETDSLAPDKDWASALLANFDDASINVLTKLVHAEKPDEVFDFFSTLLATEYPRSDHQPLIFPAMDEHLVAHYLALIHSLEKTLTLDEKASTLDLLHEIYAHLWAEYYPLVIEHGVWRTPSWLVGESLDEIYDAVEKWFPICREYLKAVRLVEDPMSPAAPKVDMESPHPMCTVGRSGPPYVDFTQLGKTAYWTGDWMRKKKRSQEGPLAEDMYFDGSFTGCPSPWIHHCGFRSDWSDNATISRTNPLYELRIDHHSFRSIFKRSLGYPKWRKDHMLGYIHTRKDDTGPYEHFVNSFRDPGASVWVPELRARLRELGPLPRFLPKELDERTSHVHNKEVQTYSVLGELLSELRAQCPKTHPYVGLSMLSAPPPPRPLIMGGFCVDEKEGRHSAREFLTAKVVMCPGFPETSCMDRISDGKAAFFVDRLSSYGARNTSYLSWPSPTVCVNCAFVKL